MDPRVKTIREDKKVGCGSCTTIDECFDDSDLIEKLNRNNIKTPEEALKWAYKYEDIYMEDMLNKRFGSDDDLELKLYKEWKESIND